MAATAYAQPEPLSVAGREVTPGVVRLPAIAPPVTEGMAPLFQTAGTEDIETLRAAGSLPPIEEMPVGPGEPVILLEDAPPPIKLWDGGVELGLNGAAGNNETFNFRFGLNTRRRTPLNALTLKLDYFKNSNQAVETTNRLFTDWRAEQFFLGSPWTCFVHGTVEYDSFASYDSRVTGDAGVGYKFIENDRTFLIVRGGGGASREFGSPQPDVVPEAVFGIDFQHRIGLRHRLVASCEYMPDVTNFGHFRINSQGAYELLLDQGTNLSLKLGILDRYNSLSYGNDPNDLDYSLTLLWKF